MSTMMPFLSKLLQKESMRNAFVKDAEQLLDKHDLTPEDKKILMQIAKSAKKKATNVKDAKGARSKNRDRLLGHLSKELSSHLGAGGSFDPHW
jgi:hypothetical protein